jgi:hypothetical protein
VDHGTFEEDDPVTWDTLVFHGVIRSGEPVPNSPAHPLQWMQAGCGDEAASTTVVGPWRGEPKPVTDGARESEGCVVAVTSGNGWQLDPGE